MKFVVVAAVLAVSVSGCAVRGTGEGLLSDAQIEAKDDNVCRGFGAKPGSQPYVDCRLRLRTDRSTQDTVRRYL